MMLEHNDDQLDPQLLEAARQYHEPPPTPREEMWQAIQARRQAPRRIGSTPMLRWTVWSVGVAAVLLLGIAIGWQAGRFEEPGQQIAASGDSAAPEGGEAIPSRASAALQVAALRHLNRTEAFLTLFRASVRSGQEAPLAPQTARQLLASNRLLRSSRAAADPAIQTLLDDVELVLAQIAGLRDDSWSGETDLITEGLEQKAVLPRLQVAVSSSSEFVGFQL